MRVILEGWWYALGEVISYGIGLEDSILGFGVGNILPRGGLRVYLVGGKEAG